MKKGILVTISLCITLFQLYAQKTPSRIEKMNFSDVKEIRFEHSYGNITVTESDSNQVDLEIQYFDDEEIKHVSHISLTDKSLEIRTERPAKKRLLNNNNEARINYIIAVPKDIAMRVNLKYGNISMSDFYDDFECDVKYGNLNANTFYKSPVIISSKYSNVVIDKVEVLDISIEYGNIKVNTIDKFKIRSKYSNYRIGTVNIMDAICSYGSVSIESVDELKATLKYSPTNIDYLDKKLEMECGYSNIKVGASSKDLETVTFDGSYSNFALDLHDDLSANLSVHLKYGNLQIDEKHHTKYSFSETDYKNTVKKGVIGDKTPTANISISDSYANVRIK
jgi:hypothetical protein